MLSHGWNITAAATTTTTSKARETSQKRGWKKIRPRGWKEYCENLVCVYHIAVIYMNSQQLWLQIQDLHKINEIKNSSIKWEGIPSVPLIATDNY